MSDEEMRRVSDALDAVERIGDAEARVRAKSRVMAEQVRRNREWARERRELIERLHREEQLSYRQIAARLDVTLSTVQDVFRNYTGSGTHRPRTGNRETTEGERAE
ncbi:helix-turn-helix domain-containing protein [Yinghuangia sp. ASG 101]|uniref:helix-turn-helix domain-containing protein n=1 Tax=Yinghuangia sp. ASG 101 TaxID=2896848 RepID=UPI001E5FB05D|nr:helix-turn-helix domain-containing protein [Yinghuangia sp. ASG 101]UGQ10903.1 helix-turn-helix domain-containing protein [Yinghuangia sp. ASG 101]